MGLLLREQRERRKEEWKRNGRGKGEVRERSKEWDGVGKERKR